LDLGELARVDLLADAGALVGVVVELELAALGARLREGADDPDGEPARQLAVDVVVVLAQPVRADAGEGRVAAAVPVRVLAGHDLAVELEFGDLAVDGDDDLAA